MGGGVFYCSVHTLWTLFSLYVYSPSFLKKENFSCIPVMRIQIQVRKDP